MLRNRVIGMLHPLRGVTTWACQRGLLPDGMRKVLPWRWVTEPFTIYGPGWKARWHPTETDSVAHRIFWSGLRRWERETAPVILENIARSRCFLDIGANSGFYTVAGALANPQVRVVAFEPVPEVFALLRRNVEGNGVSGRVTLLNMALAEQNGRVEFHQAEDSTMGSLEVSGYQGQGGKVIEVECGTLDRVVDELGVEPDFMKIDVEGFEHAVLGGAGGVLARFRPRMVLEANPGDRCDLVTEILLRHGYRFQLIGDRGLEEHPAIVADERFHNWLCSAS